MKSLLGLALLLSPVAMWPAKAEPWQLERSGVEMVEAPDGHAYRVLVAWPEGEPPADGWPVLWVLDGEDNFATVAMTARRLARAGQRSGVEPGLVVGIDSGALPRRVLDYTPATAGYAIPEGAPAHGLETGGADTFLAFLDAQVKPAIETRWPTDPSRHTLFGHSFGGLLALYALFSGHGFDRIVAVSPSLWFGDGLMEREERGMKPGASKTVLIAAGDEGGADASSGSAAEALAARLEAKGMDARFLPLPGRSHGSTMLAATADAVALAFGRGKER